ncbi:SIR2 family protein [Staphylococcus saprophyticus]|nr:SIR2 family protein [Staphylococcus saprophyticus]
MGEKEFYKNQINNLEKYIKKMNVRPILFIGSGFSQRYINAPNWEGLLEYLIEENTMIKMPLQYFIQQFDGDLSMVATELVKFYYEYAWNNMEDFPKELFDSSDKSIYLKYKISVFLKNATNDMDCSDENLKNELDILKTLSPHSIITTNYDNLIDKIFPDYEVIIGQQIIKQKEATDIGHILKIHGTVENISSLIIEKSDYDEFNSKQIYLIAKLFTYFVEHPIIFIGYSINDVNIKTILNNVKKIHGIENGNKLENIWFIDWSQEELTNKVEGEEKYKNIDIGDGDYVKLNYIKQHLFVDLYNSLYQKSVNINLLKNFEAAVYNVVKSDSITDLQVDIASLRYMTDSNNVLRTFTHDPSSDDSKQNKTLLSFALINEANQLAVQYNYTATELSQRVFSDTSSHWTKVYKIINQIAKETGVNIRKSNNKYHIDLHGVSRYTEKAVDLLKNFKDNNPCILEIHEKKYNLNKKH